MKRNVAQYINLLKWFLHLWKKFVVCMDNHCSTSSFSCIAWGLQWPFWGFSVTCNKKLSDCIMSNHIAENNYVVWWVKTQCNPASRFLAMCTLNTINLLEIVYKVYNKLVKKILFIWNTGKATINIRLTRVSVLSIQYLCSAKLMILKSFKFWQFQTHEYR